jgi:hypothetical protein
VGAQRKTTERNQSSTAVLLAQATAFDRLAGAKDGGPMPVRISDTLSLSDVANSFVIAALIIVFLYVAGPIVEPLVLAGLLGFILAPVMRRLRNWGFPKVLAAICCVILSLSVLGALGTTLAIEVRNLAQDLPTYEANLRGKIQLIGKPSIFSGALERASETLHDLQEELARTDRSSEQTAVGQTDTVKPLTVEIHQPEHRWRLPRWLSSFCYSYCFNGKIFATGFSGLRALPTFTAVQQPSTTPRRGSAAST